MPDILLFGATGYTGKLTAAALAARGADFAVAGRNRDKLARLADDTGAAAIRVVEAGDVEGLTRALADVKVLVTCVGPFLELGDTAVEAALRGGVHYVDSAGEGPFVEKLIRERDEDALRAGIAMAPAMGFDEVPGDVATALATEGLDLPDVVLTYAFPSQASAGTLRSVLGIVPARGRWTVDGRTQWVRAGAETRWAPMPPPLGPQASIAFPLAICHLAPLHVKVNGFRTFSTAGTWQRLGMRATMPVLSALLSSRAVRNLAEKAIARLPEGPADAARAKGKWTILAEATTPEGQWRNVVLTGTDVYGLTGHLLAAAATEMSRDGYSGRGVLAPMQAVGVDSLRRELEDFGARIEEFGVKR
ncbi:MAG: trans-acting enoyl reductase family protein [Actinomycetota bacterium]